MTHRDTGKTRSRSHHALNDDQANLFDEPARTLIHRGVKLVVPEEWMDEPDSTIIKLLDCKDTAWRWYPNVVAWRRKHDKRGSNRSMKQRARDALAYYGCTCRRCDEDDPDTLSIHHLEHDGATHRRQTRRSGWRLWLWLAKHNYPAGYATLCMNCNVKLERLRERGEPDSQVWKHPVPGRCLGAGHQSQ